MTPAVAGQRVAMATKWLKSSSSRSVVLRASSSQAHGVTWKVKMLYDGDCPLCMREVNMLVRARRRVCVCPTSGLDLLTYLSTVAEEAGREPRQYLLRRHRER